MKDRFTRESRYGRRRIPRSTRTTIYERDDLTCQFCRKQFSESDLTIDHLVPLDLGGLDEITNYVTCCRPCNQRKANLPLTEFADSINIPLLDLPVHGDPVIDNDDLPIQIRLLRKTIFDRYRSNELRLVGKQAQKKIEKEYRRAFWDTSEGKALEKLFPTLPGHVRVMVPEIRTIAKSVREFWLLVELAKSARTRNLINAAHLSDGDIEQRMQELIRKTPDESLKKRVQQALKRLERNAQR